MALRLSGTPFDDEPPQRLDDDLRRRVLKHHLFDAHLLERHDVCVRHDAPRHHDDVVGAFLPELLENLWKDRHLHPRQDAHAEHVHVFLNGRGHNLIGCSVEARVDDVHAGIAERAGNDFDASIVTIEAHLCEEHTYWRGHRFPPSSQFLDYCIRYPKMGKYLDITRWTLSSQRRSSSIRPTPRSSMQSAMAHSSPASGSRRRAWPSASTFPGSRSTTHSWF